MNKYICINCGKNSYTASDPEHLLDANCPYIDCDGQVVIAENKKIKFNF